MDHRTIKELTGVVEFEVILEVGMAEISLTVQLVPCRLQVVEGSNTSASTSTTTSYPCRFAMTAHLGQCWSSSILSEGQLRKGDSRGHGPLRSLLPRPLHFRLKSCNKKLAMLNIV